MRAPARSSSSARRELTVEERLRALEEVNANLAEENRKLHHELGEMGQQYGKVIQQLQVLSTRLDSSLVRPARCRYSASPERPLERGRGRGSRQSGGAARRRGDGEPGSRAGIGYRGRAPTAPQQPVR